MRKLFWPMIVACFLLAGGPARATLLLYEGFDYAGGASLSGQSGGSGWSGAWSLVKRDMDFVSGSLTYGTLATLGNKVHVDSGYNGSTGWGGSDPYNWDELTRGKSASFSSADGNSYWISYLVELTTTAYPAFGRWLGIKFNGSDLWQGIGGSSSHWGIEAPAVNSAIAVTTGTHLLVVKVEYAGGVQNKYLWVDPSPSSLNGADLATGTANASSPGNAKTAFGAMILTGVRDSYIDEIRVGTTYASVTPTQAVATVSAPVFSPAAGSYNQTLSVAITSTTAGAEIWTTTNGSDPVQSGADSTLYTQPISISASTTFRARAFRAPDTPSAVVQAAYTIAQVAPVVFSPPGGMIAQPSAVTLTCATASAEIRYTTDGSVPTGSAALYGSPLTVSTSVTLRAKAFLNGLTGAVTSAQFTRVEPLTRIPAGKVRLRGRLGGRLDATVPYLIGVHDRTLPAEQATFDMLKPFQQRGSSASRPIPSWEYSGSYLWDGEYAGKWLDAAALIAATTRDAGLTDRVNSFAAALRATQEADGYMGIDLPGARGGGWDLWNNWYSLFGFLSHNANQGNAASLLSAESNGWYVVNTYQPAGSWGILGGSWENQPDEVDVLMRLRGVTTDTTLQSKLLAVGSYVSTNFYRFNNMRASGVVHTDSAHAYIICAYLGGMAEFARTGGPLTNLTWLGQIWHDLAGRHKVHIGSMGQGETLHPPANYSIGVNPETCATVEWLQLSERMLAATGAAEYANDVEHTIYNALLGAQSLDGLKWCYHIAMNASGKSWFVGATRCCFWSGPRGIARMPEYAYYLDEEGVRVNLYDRSSVTNLLLGGVAVGLAVESDYPASGVIDVLVHPAAPAAFALKLRLPPWAQEISLSVNGAPAGVALTPGEYARIARTWQAGDRVRLRFDLPTFRVARPALTGIAGEAVQRGPEILAADQRDNPGINLDQISWYTDPRAVQAAPSADGRRRYSVPVRLNGAAATVLLTPYADAGDSNVAFRSVLAVSSQSTPAGAVEVGVTAQPASLPKHPSLKGEFRLARTGSTAAPLTVRLVWDGTAAAGTDYAALPDTVVIPAGTNAAAVVLEPLPAGGLGTVVARVVDAEGYAAGAAYEAGIAIVASSYDAWAEARWPGRPAADKLPDADPLSEGISNLLRYSMTVEGSGAADPFPVELRAAGPGGAARLVFRRVRGLADVSYVVERSTDLVAAGGWSDTVSGGPVATFESATDNGDGTETAVYAVSAAAGATSQSAFRCRVELTP